MADVVEISMDDIDKATTGEKLCKACGEPLPAGVSGRTRYHENCRPSARTQPTRTPASRTSTGSLSQTKTAGSFAKILLLLSVVYVYGLLRAKRIPDPQGALSEELALNDEEAAALAKPLARITVSNSKAARIAKPIVENEDLIEAGFALWEWQRRIDNTLNSYNRQRTQEYQPDVTIQPNEAGGNASDGGDGGNGFPYDSTADFRSVV